MGLESANHKVLFKNCVRGRLAQSLFDYPHMKEASPQKNGFSYFEMKADETTVFYTVVTTTVSCQPGSG